MLYDDGEVNEGKESCEHVEGRRDVKMVSEKFGDTADVEFEVGFIHSACIFRRTWLGPKT